MPAPSKRILSSVTVAFVLAMNVGCTKNGVKELQQSRDAVRSANSWEVDATVLSGGQAMPILFTRVQCPSRRDLMWMMPSPNPQRDTEGRTIVHEIWYDGTRYTSDGHLWETLANAQQKVPDKFAIGCGEGPLTVSSGVLYSDLDEITQQGEIRPGPKMTENGYDCTWWDLAPARGGSPKYTVCINEPSHLPQVVRSRENGQEYTYTLSQWNTASVGLPGELVQ